MAGKINTNSEYQIPYTIYEIPEKLLATGA